MSEPTVQWKQPAGRQPAGAANKIADLLRANQNEWAIIEEYPVPVASEGADSEEKERVAGESKKVRAKASSRASLIKQGRVAAFRSKKGTAGAFDAVSRTEYDDEGTRLIRVYAVYLGEEAAEEAQRNKQAAAEEAPSETEGTVSVEEAEESVGANA
jgi:hypothetical protein